jgi:hypothetical protein
MQIAKPLIKITNLHNTHCKFKERIWLIYNTSTRCYLCKYISNFLYRLDIQLSFLLFPIKAEVLGLYRKHTQLQTQIDIQIKLTSTGLRLIRRSSNLVFPYITANFLKEFFFYSFQETISMIIT